MKYNKEELEKLILIDHIPYNTIGTMYGCTGSNIRKTAQRLGIILPIKRSINKTEHFNKGNKKKLYCLSCGKELNTYGSGQKKFCSTNCQGKLKSDKMWELFLTNPPELQRANYTLPDGIRKRILLEQDNKCALCGIDNSWNNKPLVLIFDHIDGNAANNRRDNYRAICPNCDSQLDTYKSKNKNSARITRYKSVSI